MAPSPGLRLSLRPPTRPGCTSPPRHTQPAKRETEAWNGPPALSKTPQLWAGGHGQDPGRARRLIVGAELEPPPTPGAGVHSERAPQTHTRHHTGVAPPCFQRG